MTIRRTTGVLAALWLLGLAVAPTVSAAVGDLAETALKDRDGNAVGTVAFTQTPNGTLVEADINTLPAGTHAFHVHATGTCEGDFTSAGGHFNPEGAHHGFLSGQGLHVGDFPNINVPEGGTLKVDYFNTRLALDDQLFDDDGAAVVVHKGADDYRTDPAGAAGPRIACGVIERAKMPE